MSDDALARVMQRTGRYAAHLWYEMYRQNARRIRREHLEDALAADIDRAFMHLKDLPRDVAVPDDVTSLEDAHDRMVAIARRRVGDPMAEAVMKRAFVTAWNNSMPYDDVQSLARSLFKGDYRRDLVKAMARTNMTTIYTGWLFAGLVPIDWIIDFYRRHDTDTPASNRAYNVPARHFARLIAHLDVSSRRKLLKLSMGELSRMSYIGHDPRVIIDPKIDSVRALVESYDRQRARLVELRTELHIAAEAMMSEADRKRIEAEHQAKIERAAKRAKVVDHVNGVTKAGRRVEMATGYDQLARWGEALDNCIGGYSHRLDTDILGGVYENDVLVCNFQIENGRLIQLYGYKNWELTGEMTADLLDYLEPLCDDVAREQWEEHARRGDSGQGRRPVAVAA